MALTHGGAAAFAASRPARRSVLQCASAPGTSVTPTACSALVGWASLRRTVSSAASGSRSRILSASWQPTWPRA
eukprot:9057655-Alexandrium_andersonii.AAC.1